MRKSVIPASIVALAVLAGSTLAAATTATGTIKLLDPASHKLTLSSGQIFVTPASWDFKKYKVGEKVKVSYEMKNGAMQATQIVAQ
jgi:Cu/Ag efflux protein CusF